MRWEPYRLFLPGLLCLMGACGDSAPSESGQAEPASVSAGPPAESGAGVGGDSGPMGPPGDAPNPAPTQQPDPVPAQGDTQQAGPGGEAPSMPDPMPPSTNDAGPDAPTPAEPMPDGGASIPGPPDTGTDTADFAPIMSWRTGTAMPTARTELAVAQLADRIYVAGGYGGMSAFESYAPEADSWATHADLPVGVEHPTLAALDGLVYFTGGGQTRMFAYDPETDAWTPRASLPGERHAAAAVALGGALYVVGGTGEDPMVVLRYDPDGDAWSASGLIDMPRDHLTAVALTGRIYIMGGRPGVGDVYTSVKIYDPTDRSLTDGPEMNEGRSGFGAAAIGPWICVAGGEVLVQPFFARDTAECLDPERGTWEFVDPLPGPLHGVGAAGYDGRMYLFGGAGRAASASPRTGGVYILEP